MSNAFYKMIVAVNCKFPKVNAELLLYNENPNSTIPKIIFKSINDSFQYFTKFNCNKRRFKLA